MTTAHSYEARPLDIVIVGLAITSAWGNGHATTYRALARALQRRGHRVHFFERDVPWYAEHRDLPAPPYCSVTLYSNLAELDRHMHRIESADVVVMGSYVPEGRRVIERLLLRVGGVSVFYDIDTPVTVAKLRQGSCEYLDATFIPRFDLYLSFAGGPILKRLHEEFGAARPRPFYCSVEPCDYFPVPGAPSLYDLGYLGTYSADRQPALERLLLEPARRWSAGSFYVAGAQYPQATRWPANVARAEHLAPAKHLGFYNQQRFTLNITRADMLANGYSPSVRLFEAAACGVAIISDEWRGVEDFFTPGRDILLARSSKEVLEILRHLDEEERLRIGACGRKRVLAAHTADHRVQELEGYVWELLRPKVCGREGEERRNAAPHSSVAVTV